MDLRIVRLYPLTGAESQKRKGRSFYDTKEKRKITKKEYYSWYRIDTDMQKYFFILIEYPIDIKHPENVGLYTLKAIKADNELLRVSSSMVSSFPFNVVMMSVYFLL
jgi:hypothetical protein